MKNTSGRLYAFCLVACFAGLSVALPNVGHGQQPEPQNGGAFTVVPWPRSITPAPGSLTLTKQTRLVVADSALAPLAKIVSDEMFLTVGLRPAVATGRTGPGDILLAYDPGLKSEDYKLTIGDKVTVVGANYNAVAMGTITVLQLMQAADQKVTLPRITVDDGPQMKFCGFSIHIAFKPFSIEGIKKRITWCRFNKVRYLMLCMAGDNGWVFPSTAYPKLGTANWAWAGGEKPTLFALQDLKDLVAFADARGVTLVPNISTSSHSDAMRIAMPDLFDLPDKPGGPAHLAIVNMTSDEAYKAIDTIIGEVCDVFKSSPYVHICCDEARLDVIDKMPHFQEYLRKHNMPDIYHLLAQHIRRVNESVTKRGKRALVWEPLLGHGEIPKDIIAMPWVGDSKVADEYVKAGLEMISGPWGTAKPYHDVYNVNGAQLKRGEPLLLGASGLDWTGVDGEPGGAYMFNEPVYNPSANRGTADFIRRAVALDPIIDKMIYGLTFRVEGKLDPLVFNQTGAIFTDTMTLTLDSTYPAGQVRYTLDESEPKADSTPYTKPITIDKSATVKARWFGPDGQTSPNTFVKFYKKQPALKHDALGAAVTISPDNPGYYNGGPKSLTDGFMPATEGSGDVCFLGWLNTPVTVTVDLGQAKEVRNICSYFLRGAGGINLPKSLAVELSDDGKTFRKAADITGEQGLRDRGWFVVTLSEPQSARYIRLTAQPGAEWMFLAEVAVNATVPGPALRHDALGKPVTLVNAPVTKESPFAYATHGPVSFLTDGYQCDAPDWQTPEWLGFDKDLDATIDLGKVMEIREVGVNFMQHIWAHIRVPERFDVLVSDDGKEFRNVATIAQKPSNDSQFCQTLVAKPEKVQARYVKVVCPLADKWLFLNEIFVNR